MHRCWRLVAKRTLGKSLIVVQPPGFDEESLASAKPLNQWVLRPSSRTRLLKRSLQVFWIRLARIDELQQAVPRLQRPREMQGATCTLPAMSAMVRESLRTRPQPRAESRCWRMAARTNCLPVPCQIFHYRHMNVLKEYVIISLA